MSTYSVKGPSVLQVTIRLNGSCKILTINKGCTVKELFQQVRQKVGVTAQASFYLICDGEELDEEKTGTVESFGIAHGCFIDFCQRTRGGSGKLEPLPGQIRLTKEPCCLTYEDDPYVDRAEMPCGHVFSVEAVESYCKEEIEKGRFKFQCPLCSANWPFFLIRHVLKAKLSAVQLGKLGEKINDNYLGSSPGIKPCPKCNNLCERHDKNLNRVRCSICSSQSELGLPFDFCWACLKRWKNRIGLGCGNVGCTGKDARLTYLETCATKTIGFVSDVPISRLCMKCGRLISHKDACKHMTCKCGYEFCFVCLKPRLNDLWQCGFHNSVCPVAPRQTSLPE